MKKNRDSRASLIEQGLRSLSTNGYDGVGLDAILVAADVPKGSFYYFFKSKEDFALAVLEEYERRYIELRRSIFEDRSRRPMQRLHDYFHELERVHLDETPLGGCLYGVLAQTISVHSLAFRTRLAAVFATWNVQLQHLLEEARSAGELDPELDPKDAAAFLIEAYEGALIRMKVDGGAAAFARFKRFALGTISTPK